MLEHTTCSAPAIFQMRQLAHVIVLPVGLFGQANNVVSRRCCQRQLLLPRLLTASRQRDIS